MRAIRLLALMTMLCPTGPASAQPSAAKAPDTPVIPPLTPPDKKMSLEDLLTAALKHSPEIQVAEVKVREAEAELRKTRLGVLRQVTELKAVIDSQRSLVAYYEADYRRNVESHKLAATPASEVARSGRQLDSAKAQLEQQEASLNWLVGKLPAGVGAGDMGGMGGMGGMATGAGLPGMPGMVGAGPAGLPGAAVGGEGMMGGGGVGIADAVQRPRGSMADRIRKALDGQVKLDGLSNVPLRDVVTLLKEHTPGVPYLSNLGSKKDEPVTLDLKGEVQVGAFFQALQDVVPGLQVYVRDYGILLTVDDLGSPPVGAMGLLDFWRGEPKPQP
jgi:hypothetical protein